MTYAASLTGHIERQQRELRSMLAALDGISVGGSRGSSWNAREILLHLLGAVRRSADDLRQALGGSAEPAERQAGGEYLDAPDLPTATEVAGALLSALDAMHRSMKDLNDDAFERPIDVSIAGADPVQVPIGLVLRNGLTTHFDEHIGQLRGALEPPGDA